MTKKDFKSYGKWINTKTTGRCDVTPLFSEPKIFSDLIDDLIFPFKKDKIDKIVAIDALGFVLGSAIALRLKKGLVLIRKGSKFPYKKSALKSASFVDYTKSKKSFEIKKDSIKKGDGVLLVDEWIETGTQIKTAVKLIEGLGGKIVGITTINADRNKKTEILFNRYKLNSLKKR